MVCTETTAATEATADEEKKQPLPAKDDSDEEDIADTLKRHCDESRGAGGEKGKKVRRGRRGKRLVERCERWLLLRRVFETFNRMK